MIHDMILPQLAMGMSEARLVEWLVKEGGRVRRDETVAVIETEKVTTELPAAYSGFLHVVIEAGKTVPVEAVIARIAETPEEYETLSGTTGREAAKSQGGADFDAKEASGPEVEILPQTRDRIRLSGLARRLARDGGVDPKDLVGTGPRGRIVRADVEKALGERTARGAGRMVAVTGAVAKAPLPVAAPLPAGGSGFRDVELSAVRRVMARRMTEAKQLVPHFYASVDCEVDKLLALRADLNGRGGGYKLSVNDFLIRSCALALKRVPWINGSFTGSAIRLYTDIDISVAVAAPDGVIAPVLRHADQKGLAEISSEMSDLAARARSGKLRVEECQGGGFTISNAGMFGVRQASSIINMPQACIMAVGSAEKRPVVKDGGLGIATLMSCTLSADHRAVDGVIAAEFLRVFKALVEEPLTMLL
ncbi:MAG: 2-oxo acid dehydrogenase subunit E2 [Alphaproteobacteria bacterium]|nr:2-oxo acid dehydrogenase subunit E2 [Alphaproteobacteria bacterium]